MGLTGRKVLDRIIYSTIGIGTALAFLIADYNYNRRNSVFVRGIACLYKHVGESFVSSNPSLNKAGIEAVIASMERQGISSAIVGTENQLLRFEKDAKEYFLTTVDQATLIIKADSPSLDSLLSNLSKEDRRFVQENVKYAVFSPDVVLPDDDDPHYDLNGISISGGIVLIDTKSDDGCRKNPIALLSTLIHEADHEEKKDVKSGKSGLSTLERELFAYERQISVLMRQHADNDLLYRAILETVQKRADTAKYLLGFGDDFKSVHPPQRIIAKCLLRADIRVGVLEKYSANLGKKSGRDFELGLACYFAKIAKTMPLDKALTMLYSYAADNKGTLAEVSAWSAIQWLRKDMLKTTSSADWPYGSDGIGLNFSKKPLQNRIGGAVRGNDTYAVIGKPTLQELLEGKRYEEAGPLGSIPASTEYRLVDIDLIRVKTTAERTTIFIPDREGKPRHDFYRCYIEAIDRNNDKVNDGIAVYYVNNDLKREDGACLAKVDFYNSKGGFVGSGMQWCLFRAKGIDLAFDPKIQAVLWNLR
jgi:hypothetical protein